MRSLKVLSEELMHTQNALNSIGKEFEETKRDILKKPQDKYVWRILLYIGVLFSIFLRWVFDVQFITVEFKQQTPLWFLTFFEFLQITIFCVLGCVGSFVIMLIGFIFNKDFLEDIYEFFYPAHKKRVLQIKASDFTTEPELAHIFSELEEKKQAYDALKAEYECAEQEFQQRTKAFINSCEDEEVREELNELFLNKQKVKVWNIYQKNKNIWFKQLMTIINYLLNLQTRKVKFQIDSFFGFYCPGW